MDYRTVCSSKSVAYSSQIESDQFNLGVLFISHGRMEQEIDGLGLRLLELLPWRKKKKNQMSQFIDSSALSASPMVTRYDSRLKKQNLT